MTAIDTTALDTTAIDTTAIDTTAIDTTAIDTTAIDAVAVGEGTSDRSTAADTDGFALRVRGLSAGYGSGHHRTRVVHEASLDVRAGEIVGVVGETGSGKTTLARAIAGLVPAETGSVELAGPPTGGAPSSIEIAGLRGAALRRFRRTGALHYVFQDPLRSLDPDLTVGESIAEGLTLAGRPDSRLGRLARLPVIMGKTLFRRSRNSRDPMITARVAEVLRAVGLPETVADRYPGQISGGQRQRVSIARAIAGNPRLLILDEPVSALDASNRNHILRLIDGLRRPDREAGGPSPAPPGLLLISHDLSSLAGIADRVVVLYRGRIVEEGPVQQVFEHPEHPYTALLIASAPSVRREHRILPAQLRRVTDETDTASPSWDDASCAFAPRCRFASAACSTLPATVRIGGEFGNEDDARTVACHAAGTWRSQLSASPSTPARGHDAHHPDHATTGTQPVTAVPA